MLEVRELTKLYGRFAAVQDLSFAVRPGEIVGLLGPNGSGKSTTVKMLAGLLDPSFGEIRFEGQSISSELTRYRQAMGYVPEVPELYAYLSGREYLEMIGCLREIPFLTLDKKIRRSKTSSRSWCSMKTPTASQLKSLRPFVPRHDRPRPAPSAAL